MPYAPFRYEIGQIIGEIEIVDRYRNIISGTNYKCYDVCCVICKTTRRMLEKRVTRLDGIYHSTCKKYLYKYPIGHVIGDLEIIEHCRDADSHKAYIVACNVCGRLRKIRERRIDNGEALTHSACGYGEKKKGSHLHNIWSGLKQRITYKKHDSYQRYGGRGLELGFIDFLDFYDYVIDHYLEKTKEYGGDLTIERIDNDLGYVRGNITFIPFYLQQDNTSRTIYFRYTTPDGSIGVSHNLLAFARDNAIPEHKARSYLYGQSDSCCGWTFERISKQQHDFELVIQNKLSQLPIKQLERMVTANSIPMPPNISANELVNRIARWATDERIARRA